MHKTHRYLFALVSLGITFALLGSAHDATANSIWITSAAHQCASAPDDTVIISVMLENNSDPIDDGTIYVSGVFALHFVSAARGNLIAGWTSFSAGVGLGGLVTIEVSNAAPIAPVTSGELVRLKYITDCCEGLYNSPYPYVLGVAGSGDFASMAFVDGKFLCGMERPGMLYVENGITTCDGGVKTARVHVMLVNTTVPVDDGGLDVLVSGYYGGVLTYAGYERGDLTENWDVFDVTGGNVGTATSRIRISASNSVALPPGTTGTFVTVLYQANCCAASGSGFTAIEPELLAGDLAGFQLEYGRWYCMPVATRPSTWGYVKSLYR